MKKSDPFKAALKSFNAKALVSVNAALRAEEHTADFAAVSLLDIAGFFNRGLIPSARSFEEISSKDLPPQQARDILYEISRAVVSSRQEAFVAHLKKPSSFDSSMMMSLDELHASVVGGGKIPGSIFGEVLLPGGGVSDLRITYTDPEGNAKDLRDFDPWPILMQSTVPPSPELEEFIRNLSDDSSQQLRIPDTVEDGLYSEIPVSTTQSCADLIKEIREADYVPFKDRALSKPPKN